MGQQGSQTQVFVEDPFAGHWCIDFGLLYFQASCTGWGFLTSAQFRDIDKNPSSIGKNQKGTAGGGREKKCHDNLLRASPDVAQSG